MILSVLTRFALRFRTVVLLIVGLVIGAGALAVTELDQELFPPIQPPYLVVTAGLSGASSSQVAEDLAEPIETAILEDADAEWVQSQSDEGFTVAFAEYTYGTDVDERRRDLLDELSEAGLPDDVSGPEVQSVSPNDLPVYSVAVTGDDSTVREFVNDELIDEVEGVSGVAEVFRAGAEPLSVTVDLDPGSLEEHGLTIGDVVAALDGASTSEPVGALSDEETETPVRVLGDVDEIEDVLVAPGAAAGQAPADMAQEEAQQQEEDADPEADEEAAEAADEEAAAAEVAANGEPARVGDLGEVDSATVSGVEMVSRHNGDEAAVVEILQDQDANTVRVVEAIQAAIDDLDTPDGIRVETVTNQATEISEGVADVTGDALLGALLAIGVIVVFLRSARGTVVAGVAIPLSLVATLALMNGADVSVNVLTLGALALAAGRVIDDSIVVLENITRHLEEGKSRVDAVRDGTWEVTGAIATASFSTMMVFLPLTLIAGIAREAFLGFAITVVFALAASLVISLTVVPVLGAALLRAHDADTEGSADSPLRRGMRGLIAWALGHRVLVVVIALLAFGGSVLSGLTLPLNLFPETDAEYVDVAIDLPSDLTVNEVADRVGDFEADVDDIDGIATYTTQIGTDTESGGLMTVVSNGGSANMTVELDPAGVDDHDAFVAGLTDDLDIAMGRHNLDGTIAEREWVPIPMELVLQITGDDFAEVEEASDEVFIALDDLDELENVESNIEESRNELVVELDNDALAEAGLEADAVVQMLRLGVHGPVVTSFDVDDEDRDVVVRFDEEDLTDADDLAELTLLPGTTVADIGEVVEGESPVMVSRYDQERSVEITADIVGEDMSAAGQLVDDEIDDLDLSDDVDVVQTGANEEVNQVFTDMGTAMLIAVALTYLILVGSFGSLLIPLIVMLALPFAAIGAFPALMLTGRPLGLPALIGLLMLIGIVITNSIVLLKFVQQLREEGRSVDEALIEATQVRVRPVLMTALTTIFALVPLGLGLSEGALLSAPLATVVIGGLITSTALTLIVIPAVYSLVRPPMAADSGRTATAAVAAGTGTGEPVASQGEPGGQEVESEPVAVGRLATAGEAEQVKQYLSDQGFDASRMTVRYAEGGTVATGEDEPLPGLGTPQALQMQGSGYGVEVPPEMVAAVRSALHEAWRGATS